VAKSQASIAQGLHDIAHRFPPATCIAVQKSQQSSLKKILATMATISSLIASMTVSQAGAVNRRPVLRTDAAERPKETEFAS
jgi:hypothetical protein